MLVKAGATFRKVVGPPHRAMLHNTVQCSATKCTALQQSALLRNTGAPTHVAVIRNTLQCSATLWPLSATPMQCSATPCNALQHPAMLCNTMQCSATQLHHSFPQQIKTHGVLFAAEAGVEDAEEAEATLLAVRLRTEKTHGA
jgi:hypothetical protein